MGGAASAGSQALGVFLLLFSWEMTGGHGEVQVSLEMPRYAHRGASVALRCVHNVPADVLYKVEWLTPERKLFQYVRERRPPFRNYTVTGAVLNVTHSNESLIRLDDVDFNASGQYYCEVSLDTPIFTKASAYKQLDVIKPQRHPPRITFGSQLYSAGEMVDANCTTSPAHPAPHITWFINGIKVDAALSRSYTRAAPLYRGARRRHRAPSGPAAPPPRGAPPPPPPPPGAPAPPPPAQLENETMKPGSKAAPPGPLMLPPAQRLALTISMLRLPASGRLKLTCLSTIPAHRGPLGRYADARNHTVIIDVVVAEELEPETTQAAFSAADFRKHSYTNLVLLLSMAIYTWSVPIGLHTKLMIWERSL